jgi:hypothetical protein
MRVGSLTPPTSILVLRTATRVRKHWQMSMGSQSPNPAIALRSTQRHDDVHSHY